VRLQELDRQFPPERYIHGIIRTMPAIRSRRRRIPFRQAPSYASVWPIPGAKIAQ
jgi:hypothetical protein